MVPKISAVDAEAKCRRLPLLILVPALFLLMLLLTAGSFCSVVAALLGISVKKITLTSMKKITMKRGLSALVLKAPYTNIGQRGIKKRFELITVFGCISHCMPGCVLKLVIVTLR